MTRALKLLLAVAMLATLIAVPASAQDEPAVPDVCDDRRLPELQESETEKEILVEHELFLHASTPVANEAGTLPYAILVSPPTAHPFMSADAPTMPVSTVDAIVNPNVEFHQNFLGAYWTYQMPSAQRIVCFGATAYGSGFTDVTAQLWLDDPYGVDGASLDAQTSMDIGDGEIAELTTFPTHLDEVAQQTITLQLVDMAGSVYFDSTEHPASFTYVTVETVPVEG